MSTNLLGGLQLGHESNTVKLANVLKRWMDLKGDEATWETIIDVIKGPCVQNKDLAMKIYESLKQRNTRQQSFTRECKI